MNTPARQQTTDYRRQTPGNCDSPPAKSPVCGLRSAVSPRPGFTLIELLTVIVIIAILAALLFPAVKIVIVKAEAGQARGDIKNIEHAIQAFKNEYGYLPGCGASSSDTTFNNSGVVDALRGSNPRKVEFLVIPSRKGALNGSNLVDPWNQAYVIILDCSYDNIISTPYSSPNDSFRGQCVVISYGPNGVQDTPGKDDIVSFQ